MDEVLKPNELPAVCRDDFDDQGQTIAFRVPTCTYALYKALPKKKKKLVKTVFDNLIKQIAQVQIENKIENVVVPIQININKAESVIGSQDPEVSREYVQALEEDLKKAKKVIQTYKERLKVIKEIASRLNMTVNYRDFETSKALIKKLLETLQG